MTADGAPHGTAVMYWRGCRCVPCRSAHATYRASLRRRRQAPYVDAASVRAHLRHFEGVGTRHLAALAGVSRQRILDIRAGRVRRVRGAVADRIFALGVISAAPGALVASVWSRRLIRLLQADGYTKREIASAANLNVGTLAMPRRIRRATRDAIARAYRRLTE